MVDDPVGGKALGDIVVAGVVHGARLVRRSSIMSRSATVMKAFAEPVEPETCACRPAYYMSPWYCWRPLRWPAALGEWYGFERGAEGHSGGWSYPVHHF